MKRLFSRLLAVYLFGLYLLILAAPGHASLVDLKNQQQLRINSWLEPVEELVQGQQIYLQIEIATSLKWQGGTTIDHVEIKDAIVLQREKFSVNSVRNEDGKSNTVPSCSCGFFGLYEEFFSEFICFIILKLLFL